MARLTDRRLDWEQAFLGALTVSGNVSAAARAAGISTGSVYQRRDRNERFRREYEAARAARPGKGEREPPRQWKRTFLEALAQSSNVMAAAKQAGAAPSAVYKERRNDPAFAAKWLAALHEGYDNLEIELLGYLRDPQPRRKMDVTAALRLLAAHRDTVERRRALMEEDDEQAVRASIDAFLEGMRQRRLANEAILIEAKSEDVSE